MLLASYQDDVSYRFALKIQASYLPENPYHSRIHAADVTHSVFWYLTKGRVWNSCKLTPTDAFAIVMAAAILDRFKTLEYVCYGPPIKKSLIFFRGIRLQEK